MLNSISKNLHAQIFQYIKSKHYELYKLKSILKFIHHGKIKVDYNSFVYFSFIFLQFIFPASINNKINILLYKIKSILIK